MSFSSNIFVFILFPLVLLIYSLVKNIKTKNLILLIFSIIFYSWGGIYHCILLVFSLAVNYILGKYVKGKKILLLLAVIYNVGMLVIFKYADFLCDITSNVLNACGLDIDIVRPSIVQPIGISFFTFSILSYLIDIYYGKLNPQQNILNLGLYVLMFPKVVSGPIVRYVDIENELSNRQFGIEQLYEGLRRFCIGFSKKILLANHMAEFADTIFNCEWALHPVYAWIGVFTYTLNIYLDFSAYSDMAIGSAHIFGFHFKENFNYPYISTSIQEFWRRWHISLSSWFRDYVYIPLGGSKNGKSKTYINQLVVFFLTGLWHGASWSFILWGLYHGFFLTMEKMTGFCTKIPKWISYIYSMVVVMIGWIFFKVDGIGKALKYIGYMLGIKAGPLGNISIYRCFSLQYIVFLLFSIIISIPLGVKIMACIKQKWVKDIGVFAIFFLAICYMVASDYNPFIYARF